MDYKASLTKNELMQALEHVDDDDDIFVVQNGELLWLLSDVVDVAVETNDGKKEVLKKAVGLIACSEDWFE